MPGDRRFDRRPRGPRWRLASALAVVLATTVVPGSAAHAAAGRLVFGDANRLRAFDLATRQESTTTLSGRTTEMLGHGAGVATDVEVEKLGAGGPGRYTVRLLRPGGGIAAVLPPFTLSLGRLSGPVQPSPSGGLFAMHTLESAAPLEPMRDHVYVFDRGSRVRARAAGLRDPAWLDEGRVVAAAPDGLVLLSASDARPVGRVGPRLDAPRQPAVSPDGRSIAFVQRDAVWRVNLDGGGLVRVTRPRPGQGWPAWSPDGSQLLVVRRACPPVGGASPNPEMVIVAAGAADQDIEKLPQVMRGGGLPLRACGPIYWTR